MAPKQMIVQRPEIHRCQVHRDLSILHDKALDRLAIRQKENAYICSCIGGSTSYKVGM